MQAIIAEINNYQSIIIVRHVNPDLDALGSQFGLKQLIIDNFKNKNVYTLGISHHHFTPMFFAESDVINDELIKQSLVIVVDCANKERIDDERYALAEKVIKIDHHPTASAYGDLSFIDTTASSTAQMIVELALATNLTISINTAKYLYLGMVADSNRFKYPSTTAKTLYLASKLLETGLDHSSLLNQMYLQSRHDLKIKAYILTNYVFDHGIGYYVVDKTTLQTLNANREDISSMVNLLADVDDIKIWLAVTEDEHEWRVSVRSREIKINHIAAKYGGGGHAFASGLRLTNIEQLPSLINDLKKVEDFNGI